eukprot:1695162-Amphidinium_carterae.1
MVFLLGKFSLQSLVSGIMNTCSLHQAIADGAVAFTSSALTVMQQHSSEPVRHKLQPEGAGSIAIGLWATLFLLSSYLILSVCAATNHELIAASRIHIAGLLDLAACCACEEPNLHLPALVRA